MRDFRHPFRRSPRSLSSASAARYHSRLHPAPRSLLSLTSCIPSLSATSSSSLSVSNTGDVCDWIMLTPQSTAAIGTLDVHVHGYVVDNRDDVGGNGHRNNHQGHHGTNDFCSNKHRGGQHDLHRHFNKHVHNYGHINIDVDHRRLIHYHNYGGRIRIPSLQTEHLYNHHNSHIFFRCHCACHHSNQHGSLNYHRAHHRAHHHDKDSINCHHHRGHRYVHLHKGQGFSCHLHLRYKGAGFCQYNSKNLNGDHNPNHNSNHTNHQGKHPGNH